MTATARPERPAAYAELIQLGWDWTFRIGSGSRSASHLVPPNGDQARCGRDMPRQRRMLDETPTKATTCALCRHAVGLP